MLQQYAGGSLEDRLDDMDQLFGEFDTTMPMYFLRYFGSTSVDETLNAMRFAKMRYDVAHVILDNLQFMTSGQANGKDRFEILDSAVTKLRAFATSQNVHVTLVVHPRKEGDDTELSISSVFGTAKVTQEADNVIFLQRNDAYRYVDIRKNRFCGKVGTIPYWYEEASNSIYEYSQAQAEAAMRAAEERKEAMKPARNNNRKQYDR
jgi:twinkle protein